VAAMVADEAAILGETEAMSKAVGQTLHCGH